MSVFFPKKTYVLDIVFVSFSVNIHDNKTLLSWCTFLLKNSKRFEYHPSLQCASEASGWQVFLSPSIKAEAEFTAPGSPGKQGDLDLLSLCSLSFIGYHKPTPDSTMHRSISFAGRLICMHSNGFQEMLTMEFGV